jgi:UDP-glucuronate 4-epimerase
MTAPMAHILVTGAAGFIGSHIVERLLVQGHTVTGLDSFHPYYPPDIKRANLTASSGDPRFTLITGDIRDRAQVDEVLARGVESIIHMAGLAGVRPSVESPVPYMDVNVGGTALLMERAGHHGVKRLLLASSSSVYGNSARAPFSETEPAVDPVSPYGASKRAAELVANSIGRLNGVAVTSLRLFTVYGPRQRPEMAIHRFVRMILAGEAIPVFGDGSMARDYTFVEDIVDGIVGALAPREPVDVLNLGGAHPVRLSELIEKVSHACGRPARIDRRPEQPGDVRATSADISRAARAIGFAPKVDLDEGLRRFVAWYREHGASRERMLAAP